MEALIPRPRTIEDDEALELARGCVLEHGPGVSLSVLSRAIGLSPPGLIKRFGSRDKLVFRALLPREPPRWRMTLDADPGPDPHRVLTDVLEELCANFEDVGPALAALRMGPVDPTTVFPPDAPGPSLLVRAQLVRWLARAGVTQDAEVLADAAIGAAEARGFLSWVGPQWVDPRSHRAWADALARVILQSASGPRG